MTLAADNRFSYRKLDAALKARITGMSYPANDPDVLISYDELRYVTLRYVDFSGQTHSGELIVNAKLANEVMKIFYALYQGAISARLGASLVDDFGEPGDDNRSMEANNSSAFNYRRVTGTATLSRHSLGAAIDINPLFNPYLHGGIVSPVNATPYVDRSQDFPGKIDHTDTCYKLFRQYGWSWGGDWTGDKDYQHFSKSIGS